jgi:hypothetical protein
LPVRPANCAGCCDMRRARSLSEKLRWRMPVQTTDKATEMLAIPPQAVAKLLSSRRFIAGGQGEWSVAMRSMMPSRTASHSCSRFSALRMGGAHLWKVLPSGISSAAKWR